MNGQQGFNVGKREIVGERKDLVIDPVRVAGAGMGGAAAAWGVPRMSPLVRGVRSAEPGSAARAQQVKGLVGTAQRITRPVGQTTAAALGRIPEGKTLMRIVPKGLRPGLATLGGGYLLHRSLPTTVVRTREVVRDDS